MLVVVLSLAACQSPKKLHKLELPASTVGLNLVGLKVITESSAGEDASAAWVEMPMTHQVEQWFRSRFKPISGTEQGVIIVRKASLVEKLKSGAQKEQYEMVLDVCLEIRGTDGTSKKFASALVHRSTPVLWDLSKTTRQIEVQKLINDTIREADQEFVRSLRSFLPMMVLQDDATI